MSTILVDVSDETRLVVTVATKSVEINNWVGRKREKMKKAVRRNYRMVVGVTCYAREGGHGHTLAITRGTKVLIVDLERMARIPSKLRRFFNVAQIYGTCVSEMREKLLFLGFSFNINEVLNNNLAPYNCGEATVRGNGQRLSDAAISLAAAESHAIFNHVRTTT